MNKATAIMKKLCVFFVLYFGVMAQTGSAQSLDSGLTDLLKQQSGLGGGTRKINSPLDSAITGNESLQQFQINEAKRAELRELYGIPSAIEEDYQARLSSDIRQFGYDIFQNPITSSASVTGAVPDNYILGVGDELVVTLQGSRSEIITISIDREGRLILPDLKPITAAGISLGQLKKILKDEVSASLIGTEVYVSLSTLRMISVVVVGEVNKPGVVRANSMSSPLEILMRADGVRKTGSLREIVLHQGDKKTKIDLYDLILGRTVMPVKLSDGDRIHVPTIGATIAIDGAVLRPGIYELANSESGISNQNALRLAGNTIRPTGYAFSQIHLDENGGQYFENMNPKGRLKNGEALIATLQQNTQTGKVELVGHVRAPGLRSLITTPTLRSLVGSPDNLEQSPYMLFGVIARVDQNTRSRQFIPFSPKKIFDMSEDIKLQDQDQVIFLGMNDVNFLASQDIRQVIISREYLVPEKLEIQGQQQENPEFCQPLFQLARVVSDTQSERFGTAIRALFTASKSAKEQQEEARADSTEDIDDIQDDLLRRRLLAERANQSSGSIVVREPSVADSAQLDEMDDMDKENPACPNIYKDLPTLLSYTLEYVASVDGAVRQPGVYPVTENAEVSDLVAIAGGQSNDANMSRIEVINYNKTDSSGRVVANWDYIDARTTDLSSVKISPGGGIRMNSLFSNFESGAVLLTGEFRQPGIYTIRKGEKLSELIRRAGGLTTQSYPYGAIFTRERVKELQRQELRQTAQRLQSALVSASVKKNIEADSLGAVRVLTQQIANSEVIGRVVIEADPLKLGLDPAKDIVLEPGDAVHIPKRPNFIIAIGDVLNPGALQFVPGKSVSNYLKEVGGFSRSADEDRVFVVFPNGVAKPVELSSWSGDNDLNIPPGSAIVVPTDLSPFDTLTLVKEIGQIFSSLAVSAASIAVVLR